jgi:hypothetical protein
MLRMAMMVSEVASKTRGNFFPFNYTHRTLVFRVRIRRRRIGIRLPPHPLP